MRTAVRTGTGKGEKLLSEAGKHERRGGRISSLKTQAMWGASKGYVMFRTAWKGLQVDIGKHTVQPSVDLNTPKRGGYMAPSLVTPKHIVDRRNQLQKKGPSFVRTGRELQGTRDVNQRQSLVGLKKAVGKMTRGGMNWGVIGARLMSELKKHREEPYLPSPSLPHKERGRLVQFQNQGGEG